MAFVAAEYWDIEGTFDPGAFAARLVAVDGKRVAQGRDFGPDGKLTTPSASSSTRTTARGLADALDGRRVRRPLGRARSRTRAGRRRRS